MPPVCVKAVLDHLVLFLQPALDFFLDLELNKLLLTKEFFLSPVSLFLRATRFDLLLPLSERLGLKLLHVDSAQL